MVQEYLGAVKLLSFNFAPKGYAQCNGQILSIQQNTALFSLLGTTFGGNGQTTFALPNLQSRVAVGFGQGIGLSNYILGQNGGNESVTLTTQTTPPHVHTFQASTAAATSGNPTGNVLASVTDTGDVFYAPVAGGFTPATMPANTVSTIGQTLPHNNIQPTLCITFAIALVGVFPSRN
jgi:microcystin-dependent protein